MNEKNEFLKHMKGVSPIKKNNRIEKEKPSIKKYIIQKKFQKEKNKQIIKKNLSIIKNSEFSIENLNIKKNIKKKLFKIDKKIDFHGINLLESEELFSSTITECYNSGLRCLLFVTGKGLYKPINKNDYDKPKLYHGVIRSALIDWVKSSKFAEKILSFETASVEHGGEGAFYVYLRKKKTKFI